jgi:hypothetical protein
MLITHSDYGRKYVQDTEEGLACHKKEKVHRIHTGIMQKSLEE